MKIGTAKLEAGPELDALVAEKVMGWPYARCHNAVADGILPGGNQLLDDYHIVPHFSTRIDAAWSVVEKMREQSPDGVWIAIEETKFGWCAGFKESDEAFIVIASAETLPLAVCRFALKWLAAITPEAKP